MPAAVFTPTFLYMLAGLIVWSVRFLAVYSFTAIACSRGWTGEAFAGIGLIPFVVALLTLGSIVGCVAVLARAVPRLGFRSPDRDAEENTRFVHAIAATVAALALLSIAWETLPLFLVPACR